VPFLGYLLSTPGRRRLPEDNVRRFRNRWRGLRDRVRAGTLPETEATRRVHSWIAHAEHAQTWRLAMRFFAAGRSSAMVRNRGGSRNRSANRNRNEPDNRNNNACDPRWQCRGVS
jgi:hypothetical protein